VVTKIVVTKKVPKSGKPPNREPSLNAFLIEHAGGPPFGAVSSASNHCAEKQTGRTSST
jgi:hypothetical protein